VFEEGFGAGISKPRSKFLGHWVMGRRLRGEERRGRDGVRTRKRLLGMGGGGVASEQQGTLKRGGAPYANVFTTELFGEKKKLLKEESAVLKN